MRLANAIVVFVLSNYLKLFVLVCSLCSLWQYYNSTRHAHVILSELVLVLAVACIMFGSLALTKMDCNRIANYLLLPVLVGLLYLRLIHNQRCRGDKFDAAALTQQLPGLRETEQDDARVSMQEMVNSNFDGSCGANSLADTIELFFCSRLADLSLVLLITNLFSEQFAKIIKC